MISVADLLVDDRLPSNYFASDVYVRGTLELGLLENRRGDRLLALPSVLLKAIYDGLNNETGQATRLVLRNCGLWWGKNFYARFCEELSDYYKKPVADFSMAEFMQSFQECWRTHGWGQIHLDTDHHNQGFLVVSTQNSPFTAQVVQPQKPSGALEEGILQTFFSQLTGRDLFCVQTSCESLGADRNRFVLGIEGRLKSAIALVEAGQPHDAIMGVLTR
ncbi:V4R domain-containing protein [Leptolyngbya sp. PCC 6406]|uniref:V4R domain-containing protein n=1 Tax=Leptolyngbya sp. PCC 6406 TaxID=1173264 RepID=UPI0002AC467F|nr:V4R domain-containing protein [Leptolyngbya sp. PCC 6406]